MSEVNHETMGASVRLSIRSSVLLTGLPAGRFTAALIVFAYFACADERGKPPAAPPPPAAPVNMDPCSATVPTKQGELDGKWPQYVGLKGYVVGKVPSAYDKTPPKPPWSAPEIVQAGPDKWGPDPKASLPHKTPVRVLEQNIVHPRKFIYSGTIVVETLTEPSRRARIDIDSFTPIAFWECGPTALGAHYTRAAIGHVAAVSAKAVDARGQWVQVKRGTPLLCGSAVHIENHKPGTLQPIDSDELFCSTYQTWTYGFGGVPLLYKFGDIAIDY